MSRTTVTLDSDAEQIVRKRMRERGMTFKEAVNDAIRAGAQTSARRKPFRTATASMGESRVVLDRAIQLAGEIEDEELIRRARAGS